MKHKTDKGKLLSGECHNHGSCDWCNRARQIQQVRTDVYWRAWQRIIGLRLRFRRR